MKTWIGALCASMSVLSGTAMANPVVYQQAWANVNSNSFASQFDTGANGDFAKTYDSFTLAAQTTITDIHWTGQYFSGNRPSAGVDSFLIQFWSNAGGPATPLYSETFTSANETLLSGDFYTYDADLTTAFTADAGVTYWVSIQARMLFPPQWGWAIGAGGDGLATQDFLGSRSGVDSDMAFSLTGRSANVPEPGSMLLVGMALAALGVARRATPLR